MTINSQDHLNPNQSQQIITLFTYYCSCSLHFHHSLLEWHVSCVNISWKIIQNLLPLTTHGDEKLIDKVVFLSWTVLLSSPGYFKLLHSLPC